MFAAACAQVTVAVVGTVVVLEGLALDGFVATVAALALVWILAAVASTIGYFVAARWTANQRFDTPEVEDVG